MGFRNIRFGERAEVTARTGRCSPGVKKGRRKERPKKKKKKKTKRTYRRRGQSHALHPSEEKPGSIRRHEIGSTLPPLNDLHGLVLPGGGPQCNSTGKAHTMRLLLSLKERVR